MQFLKKKQLLAKFLKRPNQTTFLNLQIKTLRPPPPGPIIPLIVLSGGRPMMSLFEQI